MRQGRRCAVSPFLIRNASVGVFQPRFLSHRGNGLRRHTFFWLVRKKYAKKDAGIRNSAYAQKKRVVPFCVLSLHGPSSKRPSGGRGNFCISKSKCGKYLTYRSRNRRRVFRLLRQFNKYASVTRFASLNLSLHEPNSGKNPRKGAAAPFLVVLRGFAKGQGSHANPAKRFVWEKEEQRNGRRLSAASGGQDEGCGVCSDATPPLPSFLSTVNGAFFPMLERKRG